MVMMRRSEVGARCVRATERAALARGERSMCSAFCTPIYFRKSQTASSAGKAGAAISSPCTRARTFGRELAGRLPAESTAPSKILIWLVEKSCAHSSSTILGPRGADPVTPSTRRTPCCGSRFAITSSVSTSCAGPWPPAPSISCAAVSPRRPSSARLRWTAASRSCSSCARRAASRSANVASAPHACTTSLPVETANDV